MTRRRWSIALAAFGFALLSVTRAETVTGAADLVAAGSYLAAAGDCVACHTRPDGPAFAGGRAFTTAFGTVYSANISPDRATGIGGWTEVQFARAMRDGVAPGGRHLYPVFPYTAYTKLSDADIHALYAFLQSLDPVRYVPPAAAMRRLFRQRGLLALWNRRYLDRGPYAADPAQSPEWNRGAYLTQALGHCGACHSPRDALGGERRGQALTGGVYWDDIRDEVVEDRILTIDAPLVRRWSAVSLRTSPGGLGAWSTEEIVAYLKTGHNARAGAFGPMSEVVANSTSRLTDPDLHAMAVYLQSLPAASRPPTMRPRDPRLAQGEIVYTTRCGDCHQPTGLGMPRLAGADLAKTAPPLAGNAILQAPDPSSLINVILYGAHEAQPGPGTWPKMSGFELSVGLDDEQIAALCTYLRASWGNRAGPVDAAAVARQH